MLGIAVAPVVRPFVVPVEVSHYEDSALVNWHVQLQVTRLSDPLFAAAIAQLSRDTTASQTGWYYRWAMVNQNDAGWQAFPAGGVQGNKAYAVGDNKVVATVIHRYSASADLRVVAWGEPLLVRFRQWNGAAWGGWFQKVVNPQVGG
jgi:hypothetical protein